MQKNKNPVRMTRGAASHRRGWLAEYQAVLHLIFKGYFPCAMRFRPPKNTGRGEIDIIVRRGKLFVAVEVKARPNLALGHEAMRAEDWQRRAATMADFMRRYQHQKYSVRFDLVVVNPYFQLNHVESAWQPEFSAF